MITVHELHSQRLAKNQERLNEIEQAIIGTSNNNQTILHLDLLIREVLTNAGFSVDDMYHGLYAHPKQLKICW